MGWREGGRSSSVRASLIGWRGPGRQGEGETDVGAPSLPRAAAAAADVTWSELHSLLTVFSGDSIGRYLRGVGLHAQSPPAIPQSRCQSGFRRGDRFVSL